MYVTAKANSNIDQITLVDRNMVYLSDLRFKIGVNYVENLNKLMKKIVLLFY